MPKPVGWLAPRGKPWHVYAAWGWRAWGWEWTGRRLVLVASACGKWRSLLHAIDAVKTAQRSWKPMPKLPDKGEIAMVPLAQAGAWGKSYPLLVSYMVDSCWPNGDVRQPAKLFVSIEPSGWQWTLKEVNLGLLLIAVTEHPEEGPGALEALLKGPKTPWMADPWARKKGRKKAA